MYRRVVVPALFAVGVWAFATVIGAGGEMALRHQIDALSRGRPAFLMPAFLPLSWAVFPAVFLAVRLCVLRGGNRRERWAVGLAPLAIAVVQFAVIAINMGKSVLLAVVAGTSAVLHAQSTLGSNIVIGYYTSGVLGLAGTCIAATWLCLFMMSEGGRGQVCTSGVPASESA